MVKLERHLEENIRLMKKYNPYIVTLNVNRSPLKFSEVCAHIFFLWMFLLSRFRTIIIHL